MRFVNFVTDLAVVLNASRSVATKHVALRSRQLESLTKTSSLTATSRARQSQAAGVASQEASIPKTQGPSRDLSQPTGSAVPGEAASSSSTRPNNQAPPSIQTPNDELRTQPGFAELKHAKATSPGGPDAVLLGVKTSTARRAVNDALSKDAELAPGEDDVPPGVDVNIFHTKRGSSMLGSLGAKEKAQPAGLPEFVTHAHSRSPDIAPAATPNNTAPSHDPEPVKVTATLEPGTSTASQEVASLAAQTIGRSAAQLTSASADIPSDGSSTYTLRESRVPASRIGRLWNYGGLAAGMMGGAISESIGRAFGGSGQGSVMLSAGNMERLVSKLSQMRGAALKFGQMMSFQDSKMLPAPIQEVLQRVQDRADYMPSWQRDQVLASNLGAQWRDIFEDFEEKPIAAASIGQVHRATLKENGRQVAVKIQFPGVAASINSDLDNLGMLLTATKLLPKGLYLSKTIDNARLELGWECDYDREAKCAERFRQLLADETDTFVVPRVYPQASGKQVMTMDFVDGVGVTRIKSFTQEQRDWIGSQILRLCLREITEFRFMQTDPNWTNFLYNAETSKLELLDFGASREYPKEFITQYVQLLAAASRSDRPTICELSKNLGYLTGHESKAMVDAHVKSILTLAEPFLESAPKVYDFKDQTITERVKALIPVMLNERLAPPPEETYSLHRKLSGAFLLCARLGSKVRCREMFERSLKDNGYAS